MLDKPEIMVLFISAGINFLDL